MSSPFPLWTLAFISIIPGCAPLSAAENVPLDTQCVSISTVNADNKQWDPEARVQTFQGKQAIDVLNAILAYSTTPPPIAVPIPSTLTATFFTLTVQQQQVPQVEINLYDSQGCWVPPRATMPPEAWAEISASLGKSI